MKKIIIFFSLFLAFKLWAQKSDEQLAKDLQNPLANLISVPFQFNHDYGIGNEDPEGMRVLTNIQPVIPVHISEEWLLINRVIAPVISQTDMPGAPGTDSGLGDILYTLFLSPVKSSFTWGVGPALSIPTGTDNALTTRKWSLGPSFVILKQKGPWTIGALANQIWSIAGDETREEVSQLFIQPFLSYTLPSSTTLSAVMEDTYNWKTDRWVWSLFSGVSKVFKAGKTPMNLAIGPKFYAGEQTIRPDIGFRAVVTFMFPE